MNKTLKAALAAFLAAGVTQVAHAQTVASPETSTGGNTVYVDGGDYDYVAQGTNNLTFSGAVGLPLNPTANIPAPNTVRVQANYFDGPRLNDTLIGDVDTKYYGIFAAGRVGDTPLEISGGVAKFSVDSAVGAVEDTFDKTGLVIGAKYQLRGGDTPNGVRLAVGAGYNRAYVKNTHAYLVASKSFGIGRRSVAAHLGVRYDRFKYDVGGPFNASSGKFSVYGGAEVPLDRRGNFNLVGEIGTRTADKEDFLSNNPFSVSLRYQNNKGFAISGGVARQSLLTNKSVGYDVDDTRIFVTAGQTF